MLRNALAVVVLAAAALSVSACDGSEADDNDVDTSIVDDPNVPFDPDVSDGIATDTNELENQGFETEDLPGPVGKVSELPSD